MAETRHVFQVRQTLNIQGTARVIDFMVDKGKIGSDSPQRIVLQITEDNKRILSVSIDKEKIVDLNEGKGTSYKFVIDIDRSTYDSDTKLTAEIVDRKGRDFPWFDTPDDSLRAYIYEKSVESLVNDFIKDLLNFLSYRISVKTKRE
uniref:Uncharacterized protein n=1 Tax=archaeon enrichment culture clone 1(2010) TaxID=795325 RepID=D9CGF3_9ARCH|nr:hypothetical protein pHA1_gp29 [archaeon enrichment culture clone 1(2010)]